MRYYPAFLDLEHARCLVVGYGGVGRRKLATLLDASPAAVLVLDPADPASHPEDARRLLDAPQVVYANRSFGMEDLEGVSLCVAATPLRKENARIAAACRERGVLCNVADDPDAGSFIVPSHVELDGVTVAISTAGQSPALARRLRREMETHLAGYGALATVLGRIRPRVLDLGMETPANTAIFRGIVESDLKDALAAGNRDEAQDILRAHLPESLHPALEDLLHDLV
ncbi:bifunctional precorrin-2 dehydrogenase/sirohydrochlorin ferrochelatase [Oceanidesulfovibrio indonesiensis]|uniref:precorrin-2 dehydrogenase n=1 Tax=Oceanidesulfovibrio indonesiensis TaxID=54767 RepID=A0A7M3MCT9_9BACT|nr:bifunctional precorrin-2 dehydrogenase/sirohydrochlorin ferrochelatase [Oceanidesulfovibrio indonesiensis]TVM15875.1 bifunctional precorrin-2 dehydrogenase/sirohydrochlorin ferrochelatase [Oceanidesulfovibrio indonesiensis]